LPFGQGVMVARLAIPYLAQPGHLKTTISVANFYDNKVAGEPIELHNGETFLVLPLPAGTYMWEDFRIGSYKSEWGHAPMHFNIVAGKINYVGDITVQMTQDSRFTVGYMPGYRADVHVYDYGNVFLPRIAAAYPQLWANYPVAVSITSEPDYRFLRSEAR
jgi:hypothetical protein